MRTGICSLRSVLTAEACWDKHIRTARVETWMSGTAKSSRGSCWRRLSTPHSYGTSRTRHLDQITQVDRTDYAPLSLKVDDPGMRSST